MNNDYAKMCILDSISDHKEKKDFFFLILKFSISKQNIILWCSKRYMKYKKQKFFLWNRNSVKNQKKERNTYYLLRNYTHGTMGEFKNIYSAVIPVILFFLFIFLFKSVCANNIFFRSQPGVLTPLRKTTQGLISFSLLL